jgi:hypothetical protein
MSGAEGGGDACLVAFLASSKFSIIYLMRIQDMGQKSPGIRYPLVLPDEMFHSRSALWGASAPLAHG